MGAAPHSLSSLIRACAACGAAARFDHSAPRRELPHSTKAAAAAAHTREICTDFATIANLLAAGALILSSAAFETLGTTVPSLKGTHAALCAMVGRRGPCTRKVGSRTTRLAPHRVHRFKGPNLAGLAASSEGDSIPFKSSVAAAPDFIPAC